MSDADFISKSQKKRDMLGLQSVGEQLIELSNDQLRQIELPESLREAVLEARRIAEHASKHSALKRQRQYIGRVMREVDVAPIVEQLNALKGPSRRQAALLHSTEQWRERLLRADNEFEAFIHEFPAAPIARIRELVAGTLAERAQQKPPKNFRELYHVIHALIQDKLHPHP